MPHFAYTFFFEKNHYLCGYYSKIKLFFRPILLRLFLMMSFFAEIGVFALQMCVVVYFVRIFAFGN